MHQNMKDPKSPQRKGSKSQSFLRLGKSSCSAIFSQGYSTFLYWMVQKEKTDIRKNICLIPPLDFTSSVHKFTIAHDTYPVYRLLQWLLSFLPQAENLTNGVRLHCKIISFSLSPFPTPYQLFSPTSSFASAKLSALTLRPPS